MRKIPPIKKKDNITIKKLSNDNILDSNIDIINNMHLRQNIYISLATIPPRLMNDEFEDVLISLLNQKLSPIKIIVNFCKKFKRSFDETYHFALIEHKIKILENKYQKIKFNFTEDYGPITKILGLKDMVFQDNDVVIIVDDDWCMNDHMTFYHLFAMQIYNSEGVFIDEKQILDQDKMIYLSNDNIIYNDYSANVYGWLGFSLKCKHIQNIVSFYNKYIMIDDCLWKHDDLLLTFFYKYYGLNIAGLNIYFNNCLKNKRKKIEMNNALRLEPHEFTMRKYLSEKVTKEFDDKIPPIKYNICNKIPKRSLLYNTSSIIYDPTKNNFHDIHIDIKYISKQIFALTLSYFSNNIPKNIYLNYKNTYLCLKINNINKSKIITQFFKTSFIIDKISHINTSFNIIQTSNTISQKKFMSIRTILSYIPHMEYVFFNDTDINNYMIKYHNKIKFIYDIIIPGAYKSDLFRALYLFDHGGLYFDCKNIVLDNLDSILKYDNCFCQDINKSYIYNGFIWTNKNNSGLKKYILHIIYNINHRYKGNNNLEITGPGLLGKYIDSNILVQNNIDTDWKCSYITNNKKVIIKNSFDGYYDELNYLNDNHYSILWNKNKIYNITQRPKYHKINGIDKILWINLNRSIVRKRYMINVLSTMNIDNERIEAIDGDYIDKNTYNDVCAINEFTNENLSKYEIACLLSHLKAIYSVKNHGGKYFMICEDDIDLCNLHYFDDDLNKIIENAPNFDILMLNHTFGKSLQKKYTEWNFLYNKNIHVASAVCYIISKEGIKKITDLFEKQNDKFLFNTQTISNSDIYLFKHVNTYIYKYNFISTTNNDSTIHNDHLPWHQKVSFNEEINIINDHLFDHSS